jgi:hypothetical protein
MQFIIGLVALIIVLIIFSIIFFPLIPFTIFFIYLTKKKLERENKTLKDLFKDVRKENLPDLLLKMAWFTFKLISAFILWLVFTAILWGLVLRRLGADIGLALSMIINLFWFYIIFKKEIDWLRKDDLPISQERTKFDNYDYTYMLTYLNKIKNTPSIAKEDREKIIFFLTSILEKIIKIEEAKYKKGIPDFEIHELRKLLETLNFKILDNYLKTPSKENTEKLFEALNIANQELDRVFKSYIGDPQKTLEKELEFLRRKYLSK